MNMKKIILLSVLFTSISTAYCQYFTIKLGGGYSVPGLQNSGSVLTFQPGTNPDPANAAIIPLLNYNTAASDSNNRYKSNLYAGYSKGGHFDFSFGYMFNPYFGIQIDGAYLWGSTISATQTYDDQALLGNNTTIITKTHSDGLSLNPSFYFRAAKPTAKFAPYARAGIALPISGAIYHTLDVIAPNSILGDVTSSNISVKTTANVSVGIQGSIGVSYTPIPLISVWAELQGQYLLVRAKESQLTEYILNIAGQKQQNFLTTSNIYGKPYSTYSQYTNFVDVLNTNSNTTAFGKARAGTAGATSFVNENAPQDELRPVANLAAFGFAVGITFNMSKKIFQDPLGKKKKEEAK